MLAVAAEAVYHRGDYREADRLARAGLDRVRADATSWRCLLPLSVADLARGAFAEAVAHALAAAAEAPGPREALVVAALATAYAGDLERARDLHRQGLAHATAPTLRSWHAYVAGEIESAAGHTERAERHYRTAIGLARRSGATFLVGVATVGLLAVLSRSGRVDDALRGFAEVIDYFAGTGNWTHLWTTLRNLADLLRLLGDDRTAAVLDAAADQAPDAPAVPGHRAGPRNEVHGRAEVLAVAREAIARHRQQAPTTSKAASVKDSSPTQAV